MNVKKRKKTKLAYIPGLLLLLFSGYSYAAGLLLLSIIGIKGDTLVDGYKDFISLDSAEFSIEKKAKAYDFEFTKSLDSSSSALLNAALSKTGFSTAKIVYLKNSDGPEGPLIEYLTVTITNPKVTKFSTSGGADERPTESFTLHGILSEYNYTP